MKVKDAIKYLGGIDPDTDLIISWWEKEDFYDDSEISDKDWVTIVDKIDSRMDWSPVAEVLTDWM